MITNQKGIDYMDKHNTEYEIWEDIEGYVGYYQISNFGRVRSLDRKVPYKTNGRFVKGKILTTWLNNDGYVRVTLCTNGKNKHFTTSRLVASAFIPNPDMLPEVNHKDFNTKNNRVSNLEWCTQEYNIEYSMKFNNVPRKKTVHRKGNYGVGAPKKPVKGTNIKTGEVVILDSAKQGKELGFDPPAITNCIKGNYKQTKGYTWEYV